MAKRYTVTSALPYANGPLHIGHLAGVYIPADIYVRYLRKKGKDVVFIGGSDEHGIPVTIRAKKEGITPQQVVDKYHNLLKDTLYNLGISFDIYSRTTSEMHKKTTQDFFLNLYGKGDFTEEETEQYYDEKAQEFLADRYIIGICPVCGNEKAYGDQCEKCGSSLSPSELINPQSMLSGQKPILKKSKHWYLPLNEYQNFISQWVLKDHKNDWKTNVLGQVKSWIDEGLKPRAMTRDLDWGIPVPLKDAKGKVLYVWFDAPIGYISFTKEWARENGKNWEDYWKNSETNLIHFIGKDNIVFHCIIFPIMLHAHEDFILPQNVPANEFMNLESEKISTSRNWAVWAHEYLKDFPDKQDILRYVLTANAPETKDNNFTWKDFQNKNNSELADILGNFINRVSVLMDKYYEGIIPSIKGDYIELTKLSETATKVGEYLEKFEFRNALIAFMNLARIGNKFLQDRKPWEEIKNDPQKAADTLYVSVQIVAYLAQIGSLFLPFTSKKLIENLDINEVTWNDLEQGKILLPAGKKIGKIPILFEKIEDEKIQKQINKLEKTKMDNAVNETKGEPQKEIITFDEFQKLDLRVGTIIEAKKLENADKLLQFKVDTGIDIRTIISGIAHSFNPDELIGKQVTVLINLSPRKIRGIESEGMLLLTEKENGKLTFITPDDPVISGAIIS